MSTLVNFEDRYGIADIACNHFLGYYLDENEHIENNVRIKKSLSSSGIFAPVSETITDIDKMIFIYDMDKHMGKQDNYNILDPIDLERELRVLESSYKNVELKFIPTAFASETIILHLLGRFEYDYSELFSCINTAHLHTKILYDILADTHHDRTDTKFWKHHGTGKCTLKIKQTRLFEQEFDEIDKTYNSLMEKNFSYMNRTLFEWLRQDDITNTDMLLSVDEAIRHQREYKTKFLIALNDTSEINVDGRLYKKNFNYK